MRAIRVVAVGAVAAALVAAPTAAPAPRGVPIVVGAGPISDPTDVAGGGFFRVTFSPDGNGLNDLVRVRVTAKAGDQLVLRVHAESSARGFDAQTATAAKGITRLAWSGLLPSGRPYPDASYILRVCDSTTGGCAPTQVMAHLRVLSAYVPVTTAVSPGRAVPVVIQTDRPGPFTVDLRPAAQPNAPGVGAVTYPAAGTVNYTVPAVDGGLWIMRVTSGSTYTQYPLIVHSVVPMSDPPHGTALVVYPYMTWRAYDDADTSRDGRVDSWYAHPRDPVVPLVGPFESFRSEPLRAGREADPQDQQAFARWFKTHPAPAQFVTDIELGHLSLDTLSRYSLIVFPGHTEYYEQATYDKLITYRNGGGHLYFMSGNAFYGQDKVGPTTITRLTYRYRTPTQSDFALTTVGFVTCCWPRPIVPTYRVTAAALTQLPWVFDGTGLKAGDPFGTAEGEVDTIDPKLSPPGTIVLASALVPAFKSVNPVLPQGWIGTVPFTYPRPSDHPVTLDIAYAATGRGEVLAVGNEGLVSSIYDSDLPKSERSAVDRALWNIWEHFAR